MYIIRYLKTSSFYNKKKLYFAIKQPIKNFLFFILNNLMIFSFTVYINISQTKGSQTINRNSKIGSGQNFGGLQKVIKNTFLINSIVLYKYIIN